MPDFMNTGNEEQLFGREKLMMSCPESSARSPTPRGLSLNNRMSVAAGPLFGESTCQSRLGLQGSRCAGQSETVPAQQDQDQEVKCHLDRKRAVSATETKWWHAGGKLASGLLDITRAFGFMLPITPTLLWDSTSQMVLIKDVHGLFLSHRGREDQDMCVW